jgi:hypothetical protein
MASKTFNPFAANAKPKVVKTRDALYVAARYFAYKLYDAMRLDQTQWVPLEGINETKATIARAVDLGWVVLRPRTGSAPRKSEAALTDEGRRLARIGR